VYVHVSGANGSSTKGSDTGTNRANVQARLRVRPSVQGASLVLENRTGRILAMAGSFSYPLSQLNRTWQTERQPGSTIKPITYLTALQKGLQPNTLVRDEPLTLPLIGGVHRGTQVRKYYDYWQVPVRGQNTGHLSGDHYPCRAQCSGRSSLRREHTTQVPPLAERWQGKG
jgi:hypothetical protein